MKLPHILLSSLLAVSSIFAASKPNVILIYTDDLGYGDLGCYGAKGYETPELDRMAQEGMRFTDFSTSSSICTPSRAGLLTGRYAKRWGHNGRVYFPDSEDGMPPSEITIAELLKEVGYQTALIGKWHLGHLPKYLPTAQGFDLYYGIPYSNDMWQAPEIPLAKNVVFNEGFGPKQYAEGSRKNKKLYQDKMPLMLGNEVIEWPVDQRLLTRKYTEKAQAFIQDNKEQPFFLYLAHSMPHVPLYVSDAFDGKSERGVFGDVVEELDWSVGQLLQTLKDAGIAENTLVIFTSDNGPWLSKKEAAGTAAPLREGKFTDYEGGCRVPTIMWQPGTVPAGVVCDVQTSTLDMLPTIAALAEASVPQDRVIDGFDIRAVLNGDFKEAPKRDFSLYRSDNSIRVGDWKYMKIKNGAQLFNLAKDVGEKKNVIKKYPEKAEELSRRLAEVNAQMKP
ncbi:MAG: sulfatase family protein [Opitutaceae bacterium]